MIITTHTASATPINRREHNIRSNIENTIDIISESMISPLRYLIRSNSEIYRYLDGKFTFANQYLNLLSAISRHISHFYAYIFNVTHSRRQT